MRSRSPWFWPDAIFNLCPPGREFNNCLKILHGFTDKVSPRVYHSFRGQWDGLCNHPYVHPYLEKTFCYRWTSDGGWFITSWSPPIHIIPSHKLFISWPQFFKRLVVLSTEQIIVDRYYMGIRKTNCIMHWIEIYPMGSSFQSLNNWGLVIPNHLIISKYHFIITLSFQNITTG